MGDVMIMGLLMGALSAATALASPVLRLVCDAAVFDLHLPILAIKIVKRRHQDTSVRLIIVHAVQSNGKAVWVATWCVVADHTAAPHNDHATTTNTPHVMCELHAKRGGTHALVGAGRNQI